MVPKGSSRVKPDEGLMMMQELDDRLKEQIDKLEHIRLAAVDLKDNMSGSISDLTQSITEHLDWLNHLSERVETLNMNTIVFVQNTGSKLLQRTHTNEHGETFSLSLNTIQTNPKPRAWAGKHTSKHGYRWGRLHQAEDALSEFGWSPIRTRRNSDAASDMSCNW